MNNTNNKDLTHPEEKKHRFSPVEYQGTTWTFNHLDPYTFNHQDEVYGTLSILVIFSCHCFTHDVSKDKRGYSYIPENELFNTEDDSRVLNSDRYNFSKTLLVDIVKAIDNRHIIPASKDNFLSYEKSDHNGRKFIYAIFFELSKDKLRERSLILRIQSAYEVGGLTNKQKQAKKVRFKTLVKAVFEGRTIRY